MVLIKKKMTEIIERMTATYIPKSYLTMQKEIAIVEKRSVALYWALAVLIMVCILAVISTCISVYQYLTYDSDFKYANDFSLAYQTALTIALCLLFVKLVSYTNFFAHRYFKINYPYTDSCMITSCSTVSDLDYLFSKEISADQYNKLKIISDKSKVFKNKIIEIQSVRNGVITKLDYHLLNCEKIYAICINKIL